MEKDILGIVAIILAIYAFMPYIFSIHRGETKPHVFTWLIWGVATLVVYFAQAASEGGAGAWSTGISGLISLYIAYLAYRRKADCHINRTDWVFLILAFFSLPLWYITSDPLWAVILLTTADTLGFGPTYRKAYHKPYEERLDLFVIMGIRSAISIIALESYSVTTILFPAVVILQCVVFVTMVLIRRRQIETR
jgi:hypothetical protein